MKKYIGVAVLVLLLLQFPKVNYEFTRTNADAIIAATEENLIINSDCEQDSDRIYFATKDMFRSNFAFSNKKIGAIVIAPKIVMPVVNATDNVNDEIKSSANFRHDLLLESFWNRFGDRIVFIAIIIAIGVLFFFFNLRARKRQFNLLKASEAMLRNVTNNINGGVLVLKPQKDFKISYVNDGLLKLIGYSKEELDVIEPKYYYLFIHHDDRAELENLIMPGSLPFEPDNNFSTQLRIRKKDGTYVPVLVKGSLVRNRQGKKELFCVAMDISRERSMMEELEFEKERYKILMEKSDEILFEINYVEHTVEVSAQFKEKFGWSLPKMYWGVEEPNLVQVYEEDRREFAKALEEVFGGKVDGELVTRICKSDGSPCWCKILYHVMRIGNEKIRLIGKITDIDAEMKEKLLLVQKAQVDALTGLLNKGAFKTQCVEYLNKHNDINNAVVFFDVDNFKEINDSLGHAVGDKALLDISQKMQLVFSESDILGRFGGDEYCVLVKDVSEEELRSTLENLLKELRLEYSDGNQTTSVSVSVGAVCSGEFGSDFDKLLEYADKAQYFAKEMGKDAYALYNNQIRLRGYEGRK